MTKWNYKSDFTFIMTLRDCHGNDLGFPDYDWIAKFWTASKANAYIASYIGNECVNCINEGGRIRVIMDNHRLSPGPLHMEFTALLPNGGYPDGNERIVQPIITDIYLVKDSVCPHTADVQIIIPALKGDPGPVYEPEYEMVETGRFEIWEGENLIVGFPTFEKRSTRPAPDYYYYYDNGEPATIGTWDE